MVQENPFLQFGLKTKKVKVKALNDAEVTIQELTVAQSNSFYKRVVSGYDADGMAEINYDEMVEIKIEKVSASMLEPKMSVDELKALSVEANKAIDEISLAIDSFSDELKK